VRLIAELEAQLCGEGVIDFDSDEAAAARGEDRSDGTVAGTDLDDGAVAGVAEGVGDGVTGDFVDEKVLAEFGCAGQLRVLIWPPVRGSRRADRLRFPRQ
jgi:hypothetical protein